MINECHTQVKTQATVENLTTVLYIDSSHYFLPKDNKNRNEHGTYWIG